MLETKPIWSRAIFIPNGCTLKSHAFLDEKRKFKPSWERKRTKPCMSSILSWEYSRMWLKERDAFIKARKKRYEVKHVSNNFQSWMEKRKPKEAFACRPQGIYKLAPKKKKNEAADTTTEDC